ncbi:MAG: hypothetical protein GY793_09605 [Proteobacteria bacterium]|nr:hypothetical protein [Pseudomonadota bacterium]
MKAENEQVDLIADKIKTIVEAMVKNGEVEELTQFIKESTKRADLTSIRLGLLLSSLPKGQLTDKDVRNLFGQHDSVEGLEVLAATFLNKMKKPYCIDFLPNVELGMWKNSLYLLLSSQRLNIKESTFVGMCAKEISIWRVIQQNAEKLSYGEALDNLGGFLIKNRDDFAACKKETDRVYESIRLTLLLKDTVKELLRF